MWRALGEGEGVGEGGCVGVGDDVWRVLGQGEGVSQSESHTVSA